jgi:hypothetical protein
MRKEVEQFQETAMDRALSKWTKRAPRPTLARQTDEDVSGETLGPTYQMIPHHQRHEGDPVQQQIALREPAGYEHPQRLGTGRGGPRRAKNPTR